MVPNPGIEVSVLACLKLSGAKLRGLVLFQLSHTLPPGVDVRVRVPREAVQGGVGAFA